MTLTFRKHVSFAPETFAPPAACLVDTSSWSGWFRNLAAQAASLVSGAPKAPQPTTQELEKTLDKLQKKMNQLKTKEAELAQQQASFSGTLRPDVRTSKRSKDVAQRKLEEIEPELKTLRAELSALQTQVASLSTAVIKKTLETTLEQASFLTRHLNPEMKAVAGALAKLDAETQYGAETVKNVDQIMNALTAPLHLLFGNYAGGAAKLAGTLGYGPDTQTGAALDIASKLMMISACYANPAALAVMGVTFVVGAPAQALAQRATAGTSTATQYAAKSGVIEALQFATLAANSESRETFSNNFRSLGNALRSPVSTFASAASSVWNALPIFNFNLLPGAAAQDAPPLDCDYQNPNPRSGYPLEYSGTANLGVERLAYYFNSSVTDGRAYRDMLTFFKGCYDSSGDCLAQTQAVDRMLDTAFLSSSNMTQFLLSIPGSIWPFSQNAPAKPASCATYPVDGQGNLVINATQMDNLLQTFRNGVGLNISTTAQALVDKYGITLPEAFTRIVYRYGCSFLSNPPATTELGCPVPVRATTTATTTFTSTNAPAATNASATPLTPTPPNVSPTDTATDSSPFPATNASLPTSSQPQTMSRTQSSTRTQSSAAPPSTTTNTADTAAAASGSSSSSSTTWVIVGVVGGAVVIAAVVGTVIYMRHKSKTTKVEEGTPEFQQLQATITETSKSKAPALSESAFLAAYSSSSSDPLMGNDSPPSSNPAQALPATVSVKASNPPVSWSADEDPTGGYATIRTANSNGTVDVIIPASAVKRSGDTATFELRHSEGGQQAPPVYATVTANFKALRAQRAQESQVQGAVGDHYSTTPEGLYAITIWAEDLSPVYGNLGGPRILLDESAYSTIPASAHPVATSLMSATDLAAAIKNGQLVRTGSLTSLNSREIDENTRL